MKTIKFTNSEALALLHRLSLWDCFGIVFADTDGMEHLAEGARGCAKELHDQVEKYRQVTVDETSEMHREVMVEAVEGSTWVSVNDPYNDTNNTHQKATAAYYALVHAAAKIETAFGLDRYEIEVPRH